MIIRNEREEEHRIVETLIRDAFWNVQVPGATEHYMAHTMRGHKDFVSELDMVAEIDNKIVGCIMYTVGKLVAEDGTVKACLSFGPIAVHPEYQRRGIGKALVEASAKRAKEMGYESIIIFGHPSNYVSMGFVSCIKKNVCVGEGYFPTAMLVKTLADNVFDGRKWQFQESPACEFDASGAEEFDRSFPYKEKKELPCQEEFYIYSHSSLHR